MSSKIQVEGTLFWPFLTKEDPSKPGKHSFELSKLDDDTVEAIERFAHQNGVNSKSWPRPKAIDDLKKKVKFEDNPEAKATLERRLETWEEQGKFITMKQNSTRIEKRKDSANLGQRVKWPVAVKKADGSYYTKEETDKLSQGTRVRIEISTFTTGSYGTFFTYVPSSMVVLEEVLWEAEEETTDRQFVESELADEAPAPQQARPAEDTDPLNDEIPL